MRRRAATLHALFSDRPAIAARRPDRPAPEARPCPPLRRPTGLRTGLTPAQQIRKGPTDETAHARPPSFWPPPPAPAETEITYPAVGQPARGRGLDHAWPRRSRPTHPDIKVKVEVADWDSYWEKLRVQVAGGTPPDVFAMDAPLYPDWQSRGVLLNLQPYLDADPSVLDGVYPGDAGGLQDARGLSSACRAISRPSSFTTTRPCSTPPGVAYPTEDWTWDDLRDDGQGADAGQGRRRDDRPVGLLGRGL